MQTGDIKHMKEIRLKWDDLSPTEKEIAVNNYRSIRTVEEEAECSEERARNDTPFCRGFYKNMTTGEITVDI